MSSVPSAPRSMAWHIFRKDCRLLWPLALAGAGGQLLVSLINHRSLPYVENDAFMAVGALLTLGVAISISLLIVLAVQQDALPGASQDWLVRPIRRGDLLLAKVLAVLLLVHAPIFLLNLARGLSYGFPLGQSLGAALHSTLYLALIYSLPLMTIAALTRGVTEAILTALAAALGVTLVRVVVTVLLSASTHTFHFSNSTEGTGVAWVWEFLGQALLTLVLAAILVLQYLRRDTPNARVLLAVGLLLVALTLDLPWRPAFAIQQGLAAKPDAGQAVAIAFDPAPDASAVPRDPQRLVRDADRKEKKKSEDKDGIAILLPLRLSGLPDGAILHADRTAIRLVGADGRTLYRGSGHAFDAAGTGGDASARLRQSFSIPAKTLHRIGDQALRLEADYALSLLRPHALPPLEALDGERILPEAGHCATRIDDADSMLEVNCIAVGQIPPCRSTVLELKDGTRRNPEWFSCDLDYQPAGLRTSVDPLDDSRTRLPFRDPVSAAPYPVDAAQLREAQLVVSFYEPEDHFTRQLVIPQFHLRDWQAAATPAVKP